MAAAPKVPTASRLVWEQKDGRLVRRPDELAAEEPLEIRAVGAASGGDDGSARVLNVTMRTPGNDFELVAGWLLSEGVIDGLDELHGVRYCTDPDLDGEQRYNVVTADLRGKAADRLLGGAPGGIAARLTTTSSSCGVCGTSSIEALRAAGHAPISSCGPFQLAEVLEWPSLLREAQRAFETTGGLHGAALISASKELLAAREDIGRHNAVDKVVGWALLEARLPLAEVGLVVSGRTSFEIIQKALRAGIGLVAAVSAASSLAAQLSEEEGLTLIGFVRNGSCTIYSHPERLDVG